MIVLLTIGSAFIYSLLTFHIELHRHPWLLLNCIERKFFLRATFEISLLLSAILGYPLTLRLLYSCIFLVNKLVIIYLQGSRACHSPIRWFSYKVRGSISNASTSSIARLRTKESSSSLTTSNAPRRMPRKWDHASPTTRHLDNLPRNSHCWRSQRKNTCWWKQCFYLILVGILNLLYSIPC